MAWRSGSPMTSCQAAGGAGSDDRSTGGVSSQNFEQIVRAPASRVRAEVVENEQIARRGI